MPPVGPKDNVGLSSAVDRNDRERERKVADGLWAVLGASVGVVGSLATTYLNTLLAKPKPNLAREARKKLLLRLLSDTRWTWRGLEVLSHTIGADQQTTKDLLLEIGAQGSEDGQQLWALITRLDGKVSAEPPAN